ncbi:alpha-L-fucosidase [Isoptericola hypogeus]|uniref:alpha-L-fucosidase n=1 Tax=Isoptericola hypogeus TaxID=300179 RepID=A0ABP4V7E5_9MICO
MSAADSRWAALRRPTPEWFTTAPFGIFIHWGATSVPAWAEPTGEFGTVDDHEWFTHNPYVEWYLNTIRIDGSPAQRHHAEEFGGADYDDLLDLWGAERFDADDVVDLIVASGADYVVPTTKHHDGIPLWDAPGTGTRNTVHRGPRRDIVGELSSAAKARDLRLGLYYSGGLDWHVRPGPPALTHEEVHDNRPSDAEYAAYAYDHVRDLVDRYDPDILWNDINWPDEGKHFGDHGLGELFEHFYARRPDGLVNDRWGDGTHHDYATSEYQTALENESEAQWENCRGIGYSFGYNRLEGAEHYLDGAGIARHLTDVVSRGGHFLLNIGPKADGTIPELQRSALLGVGRWMRVAKPFLAGSRPSQGAVVASDGGWVRAVESGGRVVLFVDRPDGASGPVTVRGDVAGPVRGVEPAWGEVTSRTDDGFVVDLAEGRPGPAVLVVG